MQWRTGINIAEFVEDKDITVLTLLTVGVKERIIDTDHVHQRENLFHKQQPEMEKMYKKCIKLSVQ